MRYLYIIFIFNLIFGNISKSGLQEVISFLRPNFHNDYYQFTMGNGDKIEGVYLGYSEKYSYTVYNKKDKEFIIDGSKIKKIRFSLKYGEPIIASNAKYNEDKTGFVITEKKDKQEQNIQLSNIEFITFYMIEKNRQKFGEIRSINVQQNQNIIKIHEKKGRYFVQRYISKCKIGTNDEDCFKKTKFLPKGLKKTTYDKSRKK